MFPPLEGPLCIGELGERVPGPPWILGRRGVPAVAPENTIASLEAATEIGLDGVSYELRACASGELVLLADPTLDRTSDAHGLVATRTLPELAGLDAGSWFHRRFAGEPLALLEEALAIDGPTPGVHPMHVIELAAPQIVEELSRVLEGHDKRMSLRIASRNRETCIEARDLGFQSMLLCASAGKPELEFARDERLAAVGVLCGGWRGTAADETWSCERWALAVDDPDELLHCARAPLLGISTHEPLRALAARALARFAPHDEGGWPIAPIELALNASNSLSQSALSPGGEWSGGWKVAASVRNPFGWTVAATLGLSIRRGAFDVEGLPAHFELGPGESSTIPFHLRGGSWSPGGDPLLVAGMRWQRGPGRPEERLFFDTPLARVRRARLDGGALRLNLLRERPGDPAASVTLKCGRGALQIAIESAGGLCDAELIAILEGARHRGGSRLQLDLPRDAGSRTNGLAFSVGIHGRAGKEARLRRWAGGLPDEWEGGAAGRLFVERRA